LDRSLGDVVKAGVLAALVTVVVVSLYHFALTEPVIQRAIDYENNVKLAEGVQEDELLGRSTQHIGLVVGFVIFSLAWALIFCAVFYPLQLQMPRATLLSRVVLLSGAMYWSVSLLPSLKYPANPPGAGEPETLGERQALYFGFMALSILMTGIVLFASRLAEKRDFLGLSRGQRLAATAAGLVIGAAALYLILPAYPDEITVPHDILSSFRWYSALGLTIFWAVFGACFAALLTFVFNSGLKGRRVVRVDSTSPLEA
jgi:hypothetical protein